jgi:hypothetical protein
MLPTNDTTTHDTSAVLQRLAGQALPPSAPHHFIFDLYSAHLRGEMPTRRISISQRRIKPWLKQQPETYSNVTTEPNAESQPASLLCLGHIFPLSATDLNVKLLHLSLEGARTGGTSQNLDRLLRDALTQSSKVISDNPAPILENRTTAEITQTLTEGALAEHNRAFTSFTDDGILSYSGGRASSGSYRFVSEVRATCSKSMDTLSNPTGRTRTLPHRDDMISLGSRSTTDSETWSDPDIDKTQLIDITGAVALGPATIPAHGQSALQNLYDLLDGGAELSDDVETLHTELRALRTEVEHLRKADLPGNGTEVWPTLHTITCQYSSTPSTFLEQPSYTWERQHDHLEV